MIVRRERPEDHTAVHALHRAAFATDPATGVARAGTDVPEARLVDALRADVGFLPHLSLVAVERDEVVGHAMATRAWLEPLGNTALGLGPLGVRPDRQRGGIGTVLVHAVLAVAEAAGERLVALLGAPAYYRRFGFRPSADLGVTPPDPAWGAHFQARRLAGPPVGGTFRYAAPFDRL
ncbi:N-acetyltransferase [Blastococcus sp. MG754426]|uniref:GNAT family N-acetyltransferase n=1 Tax=unclassified Blastococcus TaxID=2619396 RepID=UPI001EF14E9F|nr:MULTISPECIES: N-acetyltransferase [unclassified Blastococcus]MCF6506998.1 N-acetyltransferase [Blastococcus sp. MG754426]MCF6510973.1 N-acetyltransferase [Blastococcus sp. MG754427]